MPVIHGLAGFDAALNQLRVKVAGTHVKAGLVFALVVGVSLMVHHAPVLFQHAQYFLCDHTYFFEPLLKYYGKRLREGQVPLWNPYSYCGMSQIANLSPSALYPPNWLFALLPYSQALALVLALHQLIAAIGCFALALSFGWGTAAAAVLGLIFALSGYMYSLVANYTLITSAAWVPCVLVSFRHLRLSLADGGARFYLSMILAIITTAMLITAGRPEIFAPALLLNVLLIAWHVWTGPSNRAFVVRSVAWQALALGAGIALSMPILMPVFEWLHLSPRRGGYDLEVSLMWSCNWYDFYMMAFSQALGDLYALGDQFLPLVTTRRIYMPFVPSTFIGPVAFTLAIWGFLDRRWRWRWTVITMIVFTVLMCLGEYTPFARTVETKIKIVSVFRYPIKWMIFLTLFIALGAARGMKVLIADGLTRRKEICAAAFWIIGVITGIVFIALSHLSIPIHSPSKEYCELEHVVGIYTVMGSLFGLGVCLVGHLRSRGIVAPRLSALLIVLALFADLTVTARCSLPQTAFTSFYDFDSFVKKELIQLGMDPNDRYLPCYGDPLYMPPKYRPGPFVSYTPSFFEYGRQMMIPMTNIDQGIKETNGYEVTETGNYAHLFLSVLHKSNQTLIGRGVLDRPAWEKEISDEPIYRFCQSTGTLFAGTQIERDEDTPRSSLDDRYFKLLEENRKWNLRLYKVRNPLPRAYLSQYWVWFQSQAAAMDKIKDSEKSGFNPALITWVYPAAHTGQSDIRGTLKSFGALIPPPPSQAPALPPEVEHSDDAFARDPLIDASKVSVLLDQPEHVSLSLKVDRPCWLVLTDHFYPGWQALVDSAKRPIYKCNTDMRAVYMPPGAHLVEFNFLPDSFIQGLCLAAIGLLVLAWAAVGLIFPYFWRWVKILAGQE